MASRDRDTYIHRLGVTPETASVISSKNKIYGTPADGKNMFQIGVVATFDPSETRAVEPVRGIGYGDHVAELVPGVTEPMTLAVTRTAQYLSMIFQVFGYMGGIDGIVRSLRHHKWPFDIVQELVLSQLKPVTDNATAQSNYVGSLNNQKGINGQTLQAVLTYFEGCWISDYSASYAADAALVQENCTVNVTDIISNTSTGYLENSNLFNTAAISKIISATTQANTTGVTPVFTSQTAG